MINLIEKELRCYFCQKLSDDIKGKGIRLAIFLGALFFDVQKRVVVVAGTAGDQFALDYIENQ